jgi:hypothetical protein
MRKHDASADGRPWWALWVFLLLAAFYFLAIHFGYEDRGYTACISAASLSVAVWVHWKSRKQAMFWIATVMLIGIHIALVMLLPWPTWNLSGAAYTPLGYLDFFGNFIVIRSLLRATNRQREASITGLS